MIQPLDWHIDYIRKENDKIFNKIMEERLMTREELTPLEAFNDICCNTNQCYPDFKNQRKIVETTLKRISILEEQIEKFSKLVADLMEIDERDEKKLKALEIIKEYYKVNDNSHLEFKPQPIDKLDEFYENMKFVKEVLL